MPAPRKPQDHLPKRTTPTLTPDVAGWLLALVGNLTLNAGAPDFDEAYAMVAKSKSQLQAVVGTP